MSSVYAVPAAPLLELNGSVEPAGRKGERRPGDGPCTSLPTSPRADSQAPFLTPSPSWCHPGHHSIFPAALSGHMHSNADLCPGQQGRPRVRADTAVSPGCPSPHCHTHFRSDSSTAGSLASTKRSTSWTLVSSQDMTTGSFHSACVLATYRHTSWFRAGGWLKNMEAVAQHGPCLHACQPLQGNCDLAVTTCTPSPGRLASDLRIQQGPSLG